MLTIFFISKPSSSEDTGSQKLGEIKKTGEKYLKIHPPYEEVKKMLDVAFSERFDKSNKETALGLKLLLRDQYHPDLSESLVALSATDKQEFHQRAIWRNSLVIEAKIFLSLVKKDVSLAVAINDKKIEKVDEISRYYGYNFYDTEEVVRLAGYLLPTAK